MRCLVCEKSSWENVDRFRLKKSGMSICKACGFISYPDKYKKKEEIIDYYRAQYRAAPTVENLYSGQRKLHYHHEFLYPTVIDKWKKSVKTDPVIFDVGAAYGLALAWFKSMKEDGKLLFPNADLNGSELTLSFKRNAYHEFGFNLIDDFDDSKKYDLIISYKSAEHILDFDLELLRYKSALKDDGYLYISIPTWFHRLNNFGMGGFSLEYYYSPDHINTWTVEHFLHILKRVGFKILNENRSYYDTTYLCQVGEFQGDVHLPGYAKIMGYLERVQIADEACQKKDFPKALQAWPNFPIVRRAMYEYHRKDWHAKGIDETMKGVVDPWVELDPDSFEAFALGGDLLMRYERYNDALKYLKEALNRRPKCDAILSAIANCYRSLAAKAPSITKKEEFTKEARTLMRFIKENHLCAFAQATTWVYNDNALIPTPYEVKG